MTLGKQHLRFFETFGYLRLPDLFRDEISAIADAFDHVWTANGRELDGLPDDLARNSVVMPFIDQNVYLSALLDDPRVLDIGMALCGDDFNYCSSDGNVYSGDTPWHSDHFIGETYTSIKIAFYLDPLNADTGGLRVIPGSHHLTDLYARSLDAIDFYGTGMSEGLPESTFGLEGASVPAVAMETKPGDVLVFHHGLKHASFGGGTRRRMFTLNMQSRHAEAHLGNIRDDISLLAKYEMERAYGSEMLRTATPSRMRHLEQRLANDSHLLALSLKVRAERETAALG